MYRGTTGCPGPSKVLYAAMPPENAFSCKEIPSRLVNCTFSPDWGKAKRPVRRQIPIPLALRPSWFKLIGASVASVDVSHDLPAAISVAGGRIVAAHANFASLPASSVGSPWNICQFRRSLALICATRPAAMPNMRAVSRLVSPAANVVGDSQQSSAASATVNMSGSPAGVTSAVIVRRRCRCPADQ